MTDGRNRRDTTRERRDFARLTITIDAEVGDTPARITSTRTRDISLTGLFVHTDSTVPIGTRCGIRMQVEDGDFVADIRATGHVVRTDASGMALSFEDMADVESFESLRALVKQHPATWDAAEPDSDA